MPRRIAFHCDEIGCEEAMMSCMPLELKPAEHNDAFSPWRPRSPEHHLLGFSERAVNDERGAIVVAQYESSDVRRLFDDLHHPARRGLRLRLRTRFGTASCAGLWARRPGEQGSNAHDGRLQRGGSVQFPRPGALQQLPER